MKKIKKVNSFSAERGTDEIYDPDDNLFNNPYENESLTSSSLRNVSCKGQTFFEKLEKKSIFENIEENRDKFR